MPFLTRGAGLLSLAVVGGIKQGSKKFHHDKNPEH
jgi:hypothetical protein